eukprot:TRINITY_DN142_c0_g1_i2.p1 TRINITY_DN142_c0_g1~~TRINITY_DN142_c0_g1_i2.p1  ORF type:complete len:369 (+),score=122.00 TRINITY_DN142_c0_g1_i2:278-1384(+)
MGCGGSKPKDGGGDGGATEGANEPTNDLQTATAKKGEKKKKRKGKLLQVLVAGYQQSGKSTFFKQLQIIHLNGWTAEEKSQLMTNLKSNVIQGIKEVLEAAEDLEIEFEGEDQDLVDLFEEKNPFDEGAVDDEVVEAAKKLWASKKVKKVWAQKDSLPNISCVNLDYIMDNIDRICEDGAEPSDEDVLRTRNRTTGTVELEFTFENKQDFKFVDVGGQKSERRKWSQVIENPDAVLYFTSLPDWDVPIMVDSKKTKMEESIEIWESVVNTEAFSDAIIILFLNKVDLFDEKIKKINLKDTFPDYEGGSDPKEAHKLIRREFAEVLPDGPAKESLQVHVTCALDTEQIRTVFNAMRGAMTERMLSKIGF